MSCHVLLKIAFRYHIYLLRLLKLFSAAFRQIMSCTHFLVHNSKFSTSSYSYSSSYTSNLIFPLCRWICRRLFISVWGKIFFTIFSPTYFTNLNIFFILSMYTSLPWKSSLFACNIRGFICKGELYPLPSNFLTLFLNENRMENACGEQKQITNTKKNFRCISCELNVLVNEG